MNTRDVINLALSLKRKQFTQKTKIKDYITSCCTNLYFHIKCSRFIEYVCIIS